VCAFGSRAGQKQLAVVAPCPGEQRSAAKRTVTPEGILEMLAGTLALFRNGRRPTQQAVHRSRVAGEAPLREAIGVRLERGVKLRPVFGSPLTAAVSASDASEASQNMVRGTALTPCASAASYAMRARPVARVEIGERQDAVPWPDGWLVARQALELGQQLVETALLAPQPHQLGREVRARLRRSRPFGQGVGVTRKPLGLVEAAGQRCQYAPPHERGVPVQGLLLSCRERSVANSARLASAAMGFEVVARTAPRDVDAIETWREALVSEMRAWADSHGGEPPKVMDWNRAYARRHGARFEEGWPTSYMVNAAFGSWNAAVRAAGMQPRGRHRPPRPGRRDHCVDCGRDFGEWPRKGDRCRRCASFLYRNGVPRTRRALQRDS
jgi:hypothetical protein